MNRLVRHTLLLASLMTISAGLAACNLFAPMVAVSDLTETPTLTVTSTATVTPSATITPEPTSSESSLPPTDRPPETCIDRMAFVADISLPDGSSVVPNAALLKTWRLRNAGTCRWTSAYALVFSGGDQLGGPSVQPIGRDVAPGVVVDVTINLVAPAATGAYRGEWRLQNNSGHTFGTGESADGPIWVKIVVATPTIPAPTAVPPTPTTVPVITNWRGEYFASSNLSGSPALVRNDDAIFFAWGGGSPASQVPADHFSVRWTRTMTFDAGTYHFSAWVDDGLKMWIDDQPLIDQWADGAFREATADRNLSAGNHSLRVEFYENAGDASVQLSWERVNITTFPDWKGQYWANKSLHGDPRLVRNDPELKFNWKGGAVASGMPSDTFSARWTRSITVKKAGTFRFFAKVDDGVRVWVDGNPIIDSWTNGSARLLTADQQLSKGSHRIKVEYFENAGDAQIHVWWERLPPPTPTDTPTPTPVTPSPTPVTPTPTTIPLASISGVVWHDQCSLTGQPDTGTPAPGCVVTAGGVFQANGLPDTAEPGIPALTVVLSPGTCSESPQASATTGADGSYTFTDLTAGTYCVSISTADSANAALLQSGLWTYPSEAGSVLIVLTDGADAQSINFGWDFAILP